MTWEEKIESLVKLAKAAGRYINSEETDLLSPSTRSDYYHDAQRKFREAYADFCEWRHDEPYVVDEINGILIDKDEPGHLQDALRYLSHSLGGHTDPKIIVERDGITIISRLSPTITHNQFITIEALNEIMTKFFFGNQQQPPAQPGQSQSPFMARGQ